MADTPIDRAEAVKAPKRPVSKADMDWLQARQIQLLRSDGLGIVDMLIQMRDEDRADRLG